MNVSVCVGLVLCPLMLSCASHAPAPVVPALARLDFGEIAERYVRGGCSTSAPEIEASPLASRQADYDVALYVAHPDDEAMYAGGTLAQLRDAGRKIYVNLFSHGEGGRILDKNEYGEIEEHRDLPRSEIVKIRDAEAREVAQVFKYDYSFMNTAESNADFEFTADCDRTLRHWNQTLPGGLAGLLEKYVHNIRTKRPRIVITMNPLDDPSGSQHGHHRSVGVLASVAVRLAADARIGKGRPHQVQELWTYIPKDTKADLSIKVDPEARLEGVRKYKSQFWPKDLETFGSRPEEGFLLHWTVAPTPNPHQSILAQLLRPS